MVDQNANGEVEGKVDDIGQYKQFVDVLFSDAGTLMQLLSEKTGYFTSHEFIRRAGQRHQAAYIGLLNVVRVHRSSEEAFLFNLAHQAICNRLSTEAPKLGYMRDRATVIKEVNIWGDPADAVVYRRS